MPDSNEQLRINLDNKPGAIPTPDTKPIEAGEDLKVIMESSGITEDTLERELEYSTLDEILKRRHVSDKQIKKLHKKTTGIGTSGSTTASEPPALPKYEFPTDMKTTEVPDASVSLRRNAKFLKAALNNLSELDKPSPRDKKILKLEDKRQRGRFLEKARENFAEAWDYDAAVRGGFDEAETRIKEYDDTNGFEHRYLGPKNALKREALRQSLEKRRRRE